MLSSHLVLLLVLVIRTRNCSQRLCRPSGYKPRRDANHNKVAYRWDERLGEHVVDVRVQDEVDEDWGRGILHEGLVVGEVVCGGEDAQEEDGGFVWWRFLRILVLLRLLLLLLWG